MQTKTLLTQGRVPANPEQLVEFGKSRGWHFQVMEEKGVLTDKVQKTLAGTNALWVFEPDSNTNVTLEKEKTYRILHEVRKAKPLLVTGSAALVALGLFKPRRKELPMITSI